MRLWLITCFFLISSIVLAQQKTVTGKVTDNNNQPVVGASVQVIGTNTGVVTDEQGRFSIVVPNNQSRLSVSYVGLDTKEITVGAQGTVDFALTTTGSTLNEVVVTGYSAQRKKDITGSVAVVNVKDLKAVPAGSPVQMLQGRASGLTVITSGQPGSGSNIRIRGITSFGDSGPLVIIDGVQGSLVI
jgi:hypothetical protein